MKQKILWWIHPGINPEPRHELEYLTPFAISWRNNMDKINNMNAQLVKAFTPFMEQMNKAFKGVMNAIQDIKWD